MFTVEQLVELRKDMRNVRRDMLHENERNEVADIYREYTRDRFGIELDTIQLYSQVDCPSGNPVDIIFCMGIEIGLEIAKRIEEAKVNG